jgi:ABC-type bacteriocin/lantibiotic exporter with double-glycine peptidase domain
VRYILKNILGILDKKEKKQFGLLSMLDVVINIADILSLALLLWIVKLYIQPIHEQRFSFLPTWMTDNSSVIVIAVFVLLFGIKNWLGYLIAGAQFKFISKIAVRISKNNLVNYQQARFSEFINTDSSAYIRNIAFQPFEFSQYILSGVQQIITQLSLILLTIIAIIIFDAKLFLLLLLILLPPVLIVSYFIRKRLAATKKQIQESNQLSFQYLMDSLKGYVESNIYDRNDFFLKRFITVRQKFSTALFDSLALQTMPNRIIEVFAVLGLFILIVIAKWTGNDNSATLITIGAFMAAAYKIIPGIVKVINISGQMKSYELSLKELEQNKKADDEPQATKSAREIDSITFEKVHFKYAGQPVLKDLSFTFSKGDFVGISGESGKGKTTILNLLLGFLPAGSGEILINGLPIGADEIKSYWPSIAYVRQQKFFIHDSLLKNITLEETGFNKENLDHAMEISGLEKIMLQFPEGLEKIITENGKNISGGQQQRVAIARALYKNSELILLDEPFNELDEAGADTLLQYFKQMADDGKIVMLITHDKKSLSYCNKIISLD